MRTQILAAAAMAVMALSAAVHAQGRGIAGEAEASAAAPGKYGVVIGVNRYDDKGIGTLKYAAADAAAVHRALTEAPSGFKPEHLALLSDDMPPARRPTRNNILKFMNNFISLAGPNDTVLVYFAGHGTTKGDRLFLLPSDASVSLVERTAVAFQDLKEMLDGSPAARKVLLLDACHSAQGRNLSGFTRGVGGQLELQSRGTVVLASCGPDEMSYEMPDSGHGAFTYYLLEGLGGGADANNDGLVGAKELSTYTWKKTRVWAVNQGFQQNPWDLSRTSGDIILAKVHTVTSDQPRREPTIVTPKPAPPTPSAPSAGPTRTVDLGGGVSMELVWIPPGEFMMGSPSGEEDRDDDERQHKVRISKGFWMGKYEVTNTQYRLFKSSHSSKDYKGHSLDGDTQPVVNVSWEDAKAFCKWLSERTGERFGLPSEAQWEYACRAGTTSVVPWGELDESTGKHANVADRTAKSEWSDWTICETTDGQKVTSPVGTYRANAWGLHDMIGNVYEWCEDWYDEDYYQNSPSVDPTGASSGKYRVLRGGSWYNYPGFCRAASRYRYDPTFAWDFLGFRVVCSAR